jgi:hypothetical protein
MPTFKPDKTILDAIDRAVDQLVSNVPVPSHKGFAAIAKRAGFSVPTEAILAIDALDTQWAGVTARIAECTYDACRKKFREQHDQIEAAVTAAAVDGDKDSIHQIPISSFDELWKSYTIRMTALKNAQRKLCAQALDIARPYFSHFADVAGKLADEIEANEKLVADGLALNFSPSMTVLSIRKAALVVSERENQTHSAQRPRELADFLQMI